MSETHASSILKNLYATAYGSADAYKAYLPSADSLHEGLYINLKINADNTSSSTLDINSLGAKNIKGPDGVDVSAGDLSADRVVSLVYNGSEFQILAAGTTNSSMSSVDDVTNKNTSNHFRTLDVLQSQHAGATIIESGWVDSFGNANEQGADEANSTGESHDNVNKLYEGSTGLTNQNSDKDYTTESNYLQQEWTNSNQSTSQATVASGTTVTLSSGIWPTNAANARISFDGGTTFFDIDSRDSSTQLTLETSATNATSDYIIRMSEFDSGTAQLNLKSGSATIFEQDLSSTTTSHNVKGISNNDNRQAVQFKATTVGEINKVTLKVLNQGSPTDNILVKIFSSTTPTTADGEPSSSLSTFSSVAASSLSGTYQEVDFTGSYIPTLNNYYFIVIERDGTGSLSNYYVIASHTGTAGYAHAYGLLEQPALTWVVSNEQYFKLTQNTSATVTNEYVSLMDTFAQKDDTSSWLDINSATRTETLDSQNAYYWLSYDPASNYGDGTEVKIFNQTGSVWRKIARNNGSTWQYNNDATDTATENWVNATTNDMLHAVSQAMSSQANNRMTGTDLAAITDGEWEAANGFSVSVDSLARGVTLHSTSSSQNPSIDQYRINYDSDNVAMDLRSKTFDPGASPAKVFIWAKVEHIDADGPGTFSISRNGGTDWETVSMVQQGEAISGDIRILRSVHTFTTGVSGEDLRARYVTVAGESQKLHAWGLQARN